MFTNKRAQFEKSLEAVELEKTLASLEVGEIITYVDLARETNLTVDEVRRRQGTARDCLRRQRIVIDCVRGVGLKRMDDKGTLSVSHAHQKSADRKYKKSSDIAITVEYDTLDDEGKVAFNCLLTKAAFVRELSKKKTHKELESRVREIGGTLPPTGMIGIFKQTGV